MKSILTKVITSALALTLIASSAIVATSPKTKAMQEDTNTPAIEETVELKSEITTEAKTPETKRATVLASIKEKIKEEAIAKAETPSLEIAKAEPVAKLAAEKSEPEKAEPEIVVAPAEELPEPEAEPEMVWDISATENDNVAMAFYAAPQKAELSIDGSTVYITGNGYMEDAVYKYFITTEKFLTTTKTLFEKYYGVDVILDYDETIEDVLELDSNICYYNAETGEELFVTEEMRRELDPSAFMEYSPEVIVVQGDVKNISDDAFIFCHALKSVYLPASVETIGENAFRFCESLTSVVIPEDAKIEFGAFSYCKSLTFVKLVGEDDYNGISLSAEIDDFDLDNPPEGYLNREQITNLTFMW